MKTLKDYEYFRTDNGVLYCGDCVEVLSLLENESIDLMVTSPPYNLGIEYDIHNDKMDIDEYYAWIEKWITIIYDKMKSDGRICVNHYFSCGSGANRFTPIFEINNICNKVGFKHHALAIWNDITLANKTAWGSWQSASAPYINCPYEAILIDFKKEWKKQNKGVDDITSKDFANLCRGNWTLGTDGRNPHPAPFPKSLPRACIQLLSFQGNIVLDPFMGSGTTALVCEKVNRKWVGIELSEVYCEMAKKRINEYIRQIKLF